MMGSRRVHLSSFYSRKHAPKMAYASSLKIKSFTSLFFWRSFAWLAGNSSFIRSVPQRLPRLERVLDALDGLRLAAKALKNFAFQVKDVLLGDEVKRTQVAAAQDVRQLCADLLVVLPDLAG